MSCMDPDHPMLTPTAYSLWALYLVLRTADSSPPP